MCEVDSELVLEKFEEHSDIAITWFESNYMKIETHMCNIFVSSNKFEQVESKVGHVEVHSESSQTSKI